MHPMRMTRLAFLSLLLLLPSLGCTALGRALRAPLAGAKSAPPAGAVDRVLKVGEVAPDFALPTHHGARFVLKDALLSGPAVLVFYRGDW